jgi:hypothetical protein
MNTLRDAYVDLAVKVVLRFEGHPVVVGRAFEDTFLWMWCVEPFEAVVLAAALLARLRDESATRSRLTHIGLDEVLDALPVIGLRHPGGALAVDELRRSVPDILRRMWLGRPRHILIGKIANRPLQDRPQRDGRAEPRTRPAADPDIAGDQVGARSSTARAGSHRTARTLTTGSKVARLLPPVADDASAYVRWRSTRRLCGHCIDVAARCSVGHACRQSFTDDRTSSTASLARGPRRGRRRGAGRPLPCR